jgi:hypothetical protein
MEPKFTICPRDNGTVQDPRGYCLYFLNQHEAKTTIQFLKTFSPHKTLQNTFKRKHTHDTNPIFKDSEKWPRPGESQKLQPHKIVWLSILKAGLLSSFHPDSGNGWWDLCGGVRWSEDWTLALPPGQLWKDTIKGVRQESLHRSHPFPGDIGRVITTAI